MKAERIYGLLGRKLGHSWSAPIHKELGCDSYRLIELEPEALEGFLRRPDIGGLNVTIPYKKAVMPFCDVIDETAQAIGSVNTIVCREGKLYGYNTDAAGFIRMAKRAGIDFTGKKVVILGSGGASVTAQTMTRLGGAAQVVVISRSGEDNYDNISRHADADIVVNTTPVGTYPNVGESPVDLRNFPSCTGVLDVVYNPRRTALLLQAEELGIPCSDGLPMLVTQAVVAEEHFFSTTFPDSEHKRILTKLRREMTNIVLIGMPGCGKSTVGAKLAELTGREAVDLDALIAERAGIPIPEIFASHGEAAFRALEREITAEAGKQSGKIILTGGGVVKDRRNYAALHQNGRIYHLLRDLDQLPTEGRPLSQTTKLTTMWEERRPMYEYFRDVAIDNNGAIGDTVEKIWREFYENSGS